ncbi:hypothetical protein ABZ504_48035 [Streptomyces mirabilis]|uniref:hypothetical protein n=1 Tax=Streptomyces mirabilis TaxID=68239 RepID=UPI003409E7E1
MPPNDNTSSLNGHEFDRLPVHIRQHEKKSRWSGLREAWIEAWSEDGVLYQLWEDVRCARYDGWHGMARWLKALIIVTALSFVVLAAKAAGIVVLDALQRLLTAAPRVQVGTDTSSGVWAVVDRPVRTYIAQHSAGLPVSGSTVYTLWVLTGITALILGWISRNNGVRLTWLAHGTASVWMVWTATPHTSRPVAAALTVFAWTLLSAFALRGMTLRRRIAYPARVAVRPEPQLPAQPAPAADDFGDLDEELDNIHQFQQR